MRVPGRECEHAALSFGKNVRFKGRKFFVRCDILLAVCVFGSFSVCAHVLGVPFVRFCFGRRPRTPSGADRTSVVQNKKTFHILFSCTFVDLADFQRAVGQFPPLPSARISGSVPKQPE